jgi:tetratricopeptide (TPR) repeat protein
VVLYSFKRVLAGVALASVFGLSLMGQAGQPQWKDRAEYDLFESIKKEANATTRLGLLQQWQEKYPTSDFRDGRYELLVNTYQGLGKAKEMLDTAKQWADFNPKALQAYVFMCNLTPYLNDTSAGALDQGDKAAKSLLGLVDDFFSPARKPAAVGEDAWKQQRSITEYTAYRTLGWVAMMRGQAVPEQDKKVVFYEEADKQFLEALKRNPADAQASAWAGTANIRTRKVERQGTGLFHIARAAYFEGQGAFPQQTRDTLKASFEKNYIAVHGDTKGIEDIIAMVKSSPIPPAGFKIESKDEILMKQEEELKKTNPVLALWISIKRELTGANGAAYYDSTLKNAHIPGGAEVGGTKIEKLKAKAVSCDKPKGTKKIVVGLSSPDMSEITLQFDNPVGCPEKGADIEFAGQVIEFTPEPFNVTFDCEPKDVSGLPAAAPAKKAAPVAPAKKAAPKK